MELLLLVVNFIPKPEASLDVTGELLLQSSVRCRPPKETRFLACGLLDSPATDINRSEMAVYAMPSQVHKRTRAVLDLFF